MSLRMRWLVVVFAALALCGALYAVRKHLFETKVLRVAIDRDGAFDATLLAKLSEWMTAEGRQFRFRLVPTGSAEESQRLLRLRQVDLASVRGDAVAGGPGIASLMVLYTETAVLLGADGAGIGTWRDLNRKALALAGETHAKDPLLATLLKIHGVDEVLMTPLAPQQAAQQIQRGTLHGLVMVSPQPALALQPFRKAGLLGNGKPGMAVVEIGDAEDIAKRDRRLDEATVPAASLRSTPPLPAEGLATLGVARHLMVRESIPGLLSNRLVHALLDAKRALSGQIPVLAQMGAPDLEADAVVRVHRGSRVLFQGEERSLVALAMEWIYAIPLVLGLVGTLVMGIARWLMPGKAPSLHRFVGESLSLRRRAAQATSLAEINATRHAFDRLMAEFEEQGGAGPVTGQTMAALTALDLCDRQIASRRADLDRVAVLTGRPV